MEWYNGFSPQERNANGAALRKALNANTIRTPVGPCALCGDPSAPLEYHSEDYSKPYQWSQPAAYALCRHCHRNRLHKRFDKPELWDAFKAHIRRGGYASDLKMPGIKHEVDEYIKACQVGETPTLKLLRPYQHIVGTEWWDRLSVGRTASVRAVK